MNRCSTSVTCAMRLLCVLAISALSMLQGGCVAANAVSAIAGAEDAQRLVEVYPKYTGLENRTVAVVVQADYATLYDYPGLSTLVASGVTMRIARWVPGVRVLDPNVVLEWQFSKPQWNTLPLGEIATQLNVDRVVHIEILEYRLHPPGNRYLWDGNAIARVGIIERSGIDPDSFAETLEVAAKFPAMDGVSAEQASRTQIETGLLADFVKRCGWLFHFHYEPKHPRLYRPELDTKQMRELKAKTGS